MDFRLADTFTDALTRLPAQEQKAVKVSVLDLQLDPSAPGLQMHRIDKSKDPNFWSARVNRDLRLILHKTAASILVAYVDHHDRAYAWAERRRIEAHPKTGAVQIVEVMERVESVAPTDGARFSLREVDTPVEPSLFAALSDDQLLSVGVPPDWLEPVRAVPESGFFTLAEHLPAEAAEALLEYAAGGALPVPQMLEMGVPLDPYQHPDARRRFVTIETSEELEAALAAPWDKWSVFLHPSQRSVVERSYNGPARVAGSAGTGKTVVALHRAVRASRADPAARVLLATFSEPLAASLQGKVAILAGPNASVVPHISVLSFESLALELYQLAFGGRPRLATAQHVEEALASAAAEAGLKGFSRRFLVSEWNGVIDAWRVSDAESYATVPRLGRRNRLGSKQREALWPVFADARRQIEAQGRVTWPTVFHRLADFHGERSDKPFTHIVVDEAQDLSVPQLRLMGAIAPQGSDRTFFAGDLGQRIFQQPFSWRSLGVDIRGRSTTLKVNYRTSQQIREAADGLLPAVVRDVDGMEEERRGTISVFEGPTPQILICTTQAEECDAVAGFIRSAAAAGVAPSQIAVFVRSRHELPRARAAVAAAGLDMAELSEREVDLGERVALGTMHLAKGLEFKAVAVMACDAEVLPLGERVEAVVDENELDEVYETERHLLYVACTRARERLLVSAAGRASEFLRDIAAGIENAADGTR